MVGRVLFPLLKINPGAASALGFGLNLAHRWKYSLGVLVIGLLASTNLLIVHLPLSAKSIAHLMTPQTRRLLFFSLLVPTRLEQGTYIRISLYTNIPVQILLLLTVPAGR